MSDNLSSEAANLKNIVPKKKGVGAVNPTTLALSMLRNRSGNSGPSLGLNLLLITSGAVLIYAGINNVSVVDAVLGRGGTGAAAGPSAGAASTTADGLVTMDGHPVSAWIATELEWARNTGAGGERWTGHVTSGARTDAQQLAAAAGYGLGHYGPAGPLGSRHDIRNGVNYPHGAVDVTEAARLARILSKRPGGSPLVWGGPVIGDLVHFSSDGH